MSASDRENSAQDAFGADVEKQMHVESPARELDGDKSRKAAEAGHATTQHHSHGFVGILAVEDGEVYNPVPEKNPRWYQRLIDAGFEDNGIKPVPVEQRTNTQYSNLFTIFFTSMLSLLP